MTAHHRENAFNPRARKSHVRRPILVAAILLLALAVLSAGIALAADDPGSGVESAPELEAADQRVMDEIRKDIEALPEASREIAGVEILDQSISRFALATTQQRVLVSVGELTAKLGQTDKSIDAFKRGLALAADPLLTLTCRMRLAEILSSVGRADEAEAVLATVPAPDAVFVSPSDLPPDQTDDIYEAERKRIAQQRTILHASRARRSILQRSTANQPTHPRINPADRGSCGSMPPSLQPSRHG